MNSSVGTLVHTGAKKKLSVTLILSNIQELFFKLMIYLLTAIGLSPGGSTHLHTNNT